MYYLFLYIRDDPDGGLHDYVEKFNSVEDAERFMLSDRLQRGYKNEAHLCTPDEAGDLTIVASYEHTRVQLDSTGEMLKGHRGGYGRWLKELPDSSRYVELIKLYE